MCVSFWGAMNRITENIFLGSYYALSAQKTLKSYNVSHILSLVQVKVNPEFVENFKHMQINIDDVEDENIIRHFPAIIEFMDEAIQSGTSVLVHCMAGVSRSATAVCVYLMQSRIWTPEQAICFVKSKRSVASPNSSFREQMGIFYNCGFEVNEAKPAYRQWLLKQQASDCTFNGGKAPNEIRYTSEYMAVKNAPQATWRNFLPILLRAMGHTSTTPITREQKIVLISELDGVEQEHEISLEGCPSDDLQGTCNPALKLVGFSAGEIVISGDRLIPALTGPSCRMTQLRCKKCTTPLALSSAFIAHTASGSSIKDKEKSTPKLPHKHRFPHNIHHHHIHNFAPRNGMSASSTLAPTCMQYHVEPVGWMKKELCKGELEGKLCCPKCEAKLGSYRWQGNKCSCGVWVTPAFQLQRSRVDEVSATATPSRNAVL